MIKDVIPDKEDRKNKTILFTDVPKPTSHELTLVTYISLGN